MEAATNMKSNEISIKVKEAIIKLTKQHKSLREIAKTLYVAGSTVGYILKKKAMVSLTTLKGLEDNGRQLKWMIAESFPW